MGIRDAGQVRGNPNNDSTLRSDLAYNEATAQRVGSGRVALDVLANTFAQLVASDAVEAASTTSVVNATAHLALAGDWILFTSGALDKQVFTVYSKTTNAITLAQTMSVAPSAADTFDILRPSVPRVSAAGVVSTSATVAGSVDTELPAAAALADNTATPTAPAVGSFGMLWDGATWDRAKGDSTDGALVNLGANNDVTASQTGTWNITNVSGTVSLPTGASTSANQTTEITALQLIDDTVHSGDAAVSKYNLIGAVLDDTSPGTVTENQAQSLRMSSRRALYVEGPTAHDAVSAGNGLPLGGYALNTDQTAVASGDAVRLIADLYGKLVTMPYSVSENYFEADTSWNANTDQQIKASAGGTIRHNITDALISNSSATGVVFTLKNGPAGATYFQCWLAAGACIAMQFPVPIRGSQATAITGNSSAAVATVYCTVHGFTTAT